MEVRKNFFITNSPRQLTHILCVRAKHAILSNVALKIAKKDKKRGKKLPIFAEN
jgi:hypothetical protein